MMFLTGKHYNIQEATENNEPRHHVPKQGRDITADTGCFIGAGAIVIGKVEVGDHAVIGAGSVVTEDIPTCTFAGWSSSPRNRVPDSPSNKIKNLVVPVVTIKGGIIMRDICMPPHI